MTYYIIQDGRVEDEADSEPLALYSAKQCAEQSGKDVEIVKTIITVSGGKQ